MNAGLKWTSSKLRWETKSLKLYPAKVTNDVIAGVQVRVVTPLTTAPEKASRVLINLARRRL